MPTTPSPCLNSLTTKSSITQCHNPPLLTLQTCFFSLFLLLLVYLPRLYLQRLFHHNCWYIKRKTNPHLCCKMTSILHYLNHPLSHPFVSQNHPVLQPTEVDLIHLTSLVKEGAQPSQN
jgi:hypothetical protein